MDSIRNLVETGGLVVALLLLASVVALAVSLWKAWQQWLLRPIYSSHLDHALTLIETGELAQARIALGDKHNPRSRLLRNGLAMSQSLKFDESHLREELTRQARLTLASVSAHLKILEVIALTAPLMGLFGTVLGMIDAFKAMEMAGSQVDPSILSGGIWKALLTTAVGLAVAIPVSLIHSWFDSQRSGLAQLFSDDIGRLATATVDQEAHKAEKKPATCGDL